MLPIAVAGAGALLGGLAGSQGSNSTQTFTRDLAPASALETQANDSTGSSLTSLTNLINAGPGQSDITSALQNTRSLANLFAQYSQNGGMPTAADVTNANGFANSAYAGQQMSLNQQIQNEQLQANRLNARMGRAANDPILLAKLQQNQLMGQQSLDASKTAFGTQYAQQLSDNRLNYASQQNQVMQGLASQALANRQALLSAGQSILQGQQNFRVASAGGTTTQSGGGGLAGAISGAMAGAGAGLGAAPALSSMFGGSKNPFNGTGPTLNKGN